MFMEQKILSGNIPQKDLQIQHKLYQNPSCTFCRNWHTNPKIHTETQEI